MRENPHGGIDKNAPPLPKESGPLRTRGLRFWSAQRLKALRQVNADNDDVIDIWKLRRQQFPMLLQGHFLRQTGGSDVRHSLFTNTDETARNVN
jgi:hypothetical protein